MTTPFTDSGPQNPEPDWTKADENSRTRKEPGERNLRIPGLFSTLNAIIKDLGRHMWRDATDRDHPNWPPTWLKAAGVICFLAVAFPLTRFVGQILISLGLRAGSSLSGATWARIALDPIHNYLRHHSAGLPL